jgi:hypothetical protein
MARIPGIGQSIGSRGGRSQAAPGPANHVPKADEEAVPDASPSEPGPRRPSLGALLVKTGVASEQQVKYAIAEGLESGEKLGEVLVRRGWATYEVLGELLAEQWQLPFSTGAALPVDRSASDVIPLADARELGALPIGFDGDRVLVAIAEPNEDLLTAIAERLGPASYIVVPRPALDSLFHEAESAAPAEPVEVERSEVKAVGEGARPANADADRTERGERSELASGNLVATGTIADSALSSLETAMGGLQQMHREITALGKSLALAREQLAEAEGELEAARAAHDEDAVTISRLQSEISERDELFDTLRAQVTTLNATLDAHPGASSEARSPSSTTTS